MHKNNLLLFKLFRIYLMPINKELNTHCTSTYIGYVCVYIYMFCLKPLGSCVVKSYLIFKLVHFVYAY